MAFKRGPYYVRINYHSQFGPHSQTIQTQPWSNAVSAGGRGQFEDWLGGATDAKAMVEDLVTLLLPFFGATVTYDNWVVFHQPADPGPSNPLAGDAFTGMVGTEATPGWIEAVECTFNYRTTGFNGMKLVLLDMASKGDFQKVTTPTLAMSALFSMISDPSEGWAGRDNLKPDTFVSATKTLNEKLRKSYRLG